MRPFRTLILHPQNSRTGSSRLLLSALESARQAGVTGEVELVTAVPGDLDPDMRRQAKLSTTAHRFWELSKAGARLARLCRLDAWLRRRRREIVRRASATCDVVWANTAAAAEMARGVPADKPVLTYVHELELAMMRLTAPEDLDALLARSRRIWAASAGVVADLAAFHGVSEDRVTVRAPWLCEAAPACFGRSERLEKMRTARRALGVEDGVRLILGCGYHDWTKGLDLFVDVAAELLELAPEENWRFQWLATGGDPAVETFAAAYAKQRRVHRRLFIDAATAAPGTWQDAADAVAITSRTESFCLFALEAACRRTPVVFFDRAGGPSSFLEAPLGAAVRGISAPAMAAALLDAIRGDLALADGREAQARRLAETHSSSRGAPLIWAELGYLVSR